MNLEEGFYVFAKGDGSTNAGIICKLSKDNGIFSITNVFSKVDSSTNTPTEGYILTDYTNPNSIKTFTLGVSLANVTPPAFNRLEIPSAVSNITGSKSQWASSEFIVEQNPNLIGCIITVFDKPSA